MDKKGQANAMVWIVAMFIIFFLLVIYLASVGVIFLKRGFSGNSDVKFGYGADISLQKKFDSFLDKKIVYDKKEMSVIEFVELDPANRDVLKREAQGYFEGLFPRNLRGWGAPDAWWFGVYDKDNDLKRGENMIYAGGIGCRAFENDKSVTVVHFTNNKKIILCVDKYYYSLLGGAK